MLTLDPACSTTLFGTMAICFLWGQWISRRCSRRCMLSTRCRYGDFAAVAVMALLFFGVHTEYLRSKYRHPTLFHISLLPVPPRCTAARAPVIVRMQMSLETACTTSYRAPIGPSLSLGSTGSCWRRTWLTGGILGRMLRYASDIWVR